MDAVGRYYLSTDETPQSTADAGGTDVIETVEENRELFEDLADSDLPVAEDYQQLLDHADEEDANG